MMVQLFWTRAPGDDRQIDIPGFVDPPTGPRPLVLYGSVTNNGSTPVTDPSVRIVWNDAAGRPVTAVRVDVVAPGTTTPLGSLAAGASGDVIVVITDTTVVGQVAGLVPQLDGFGRTS